MSLKRSKNSLTEGPILKNLLLFTLPIFLGSLVTQLYSLTDSVIVGNHLGAKSLAAISATTPSTNIINLFFIGLSAGSTVVIAQRVGSKNRESLQDAIGTIAIITLVFGVLITILGTTLCHSLLKLLATPDNIYDEAYGYMLVIFIGTMGNLVYNMGSGCLRGMGDSVWPFYFLCICSVCNVVLDLLMVIVLGWGVIGAAIATAISQLISGIGMIYRINKGNYGVKLSFKNMKFVPFEAKEIAVIGLPAGIQQIGNTLAAFFVQAYVNSFGSDFIAANTIVTRIDNFANMPVMALGTALGTYVAQNIGQYNFGRIRKGINQSILTLELEGVFMCGVLMLTSSFIPYIFNSDPEVVKFASTGIFIASVCNIFHGIDRCLVNALRGMGKSIVPMITAQLGALSRIPAAYLLAVKTGDSTGIFWALVIATVIRSGAISLYYFCGGWNSAKKSYLRKHPMPESLENAQNVSDF